MHMYVTTSVKVFPGATVEACHLLCRVSADLGSFVGLGGDSPAGSGHVGNSTAGSLAPSPFKLPASYEEAKERKVAAVSDLRNAVKAVSHALSPPTMAWLACQGLLCIQE